MKYLISVKLTEEPSPPATTLLVEAITEQSAKMIAGAWLFDRTGNFKWLPGSAWSAWTIKETDGSILPRRTKELRIEQFDV